MTFCSVFMSSWVHVSRGNEQARVQNHRTLSCFWVSFPYENLFPCIRPSVQAVWQCRYSERPDTSHTWLEHVQGMRVNLTVMTSQPDCAALASWVFQFGRSAAAIPLLMLEWRWKFAFFSNAERDLSLLETWGLHSGLAFTISSRSIVNLFYIFHYNCILTLFNIFYVRCYCLYPIFLTVLLWPHMLRHHEVKCM